MTLYSSELIDLYSPYFFHRAREIPAMNIFHPFASRFYCWLSFKHRLVLRLMKLDMSQSENIVQKPQSHDDYADLRALKRHVVYDHLT